MDAEISQLRAENAQLAKNKILSQNSNFEVKNLQMKTQAATQSAQKLKGLILRLMAKSKVKS